MNTLSIKIKKMAYKISACDTKYEFKKKYGFDTDIKTDVYDTHLILEEINKILNPISSDLIKDCGIKSLIIRNDLGKNKPHYPNHGYYYGPDKSITLNADIFYNPDFPDDFFDNQGNFISRPRQTLIHEFGHAYDEQHNNLSLLPNWLKLSGWSKAPKKGLKRIIIDEPGTPQVIGEWYYNPEIEYSGFTRFYAKRNPWDDWADSFAFYVGNVRNKVPEMKRNYFNNLLNFYK